MRKPKLILLITFLLLNFSLFGQDIVYDSIYGNKSNWFRIKGGPIENFVRIEFENEAMILQSKVLSAAGLLEGMERGVDYVDYTFPYDTLSYEFKTDVPINVIIYKYYHNDTTYRYYVGLRKSHLGATLFEGQYMFICPIVAISSEVRIYNGIGPTKQQVLRLTPEEMTDDMITDYQLSNEVTVRGIKVSRVLRASKTRDILTEIIEKPIYVTKIWPNPANDVLKIEILENPGVMIRIFNSLPLLVYESHMVTEILEVNTSSFKPGTYLLVVSDHNVENIIEVIKFIVI